MGDFRVCTSSLGFPADRGCCVADSRRSKLRELDTDFKEAEQIVSFDNTSICFISILVDLLRSCLCILAWPPSKVLFIWLSRSARDQEDEHTCMH